MAKAKKSIKKVTNVSAKFDFIDNDILAACGIILAGIVIILVGYIQSISNLQLLLIGFGSALLVVGGAMLSIALPSKK